MAKDVTKPLLFVFPLEAPSGASASLVAAVSGALGYYHDRPLLFDVPREIGAEPELDEVTRNAVFELLEAQIEALGLEERLYRNATSKRRLDIRSFVRGPSMDDVRAACERAGWTLIRPLEEPDEPRATLPQAPESKAKKAPKKAVEKAPTVPKAVAAKVASIEKLAKKAKVALAKGASFEAILSLEAKLGLALPIEVRAFYMAHNGGPEAKPTFGDRWLLSLDGIEHYFQMWQEARDEELDEDVEVDRGVQKKWWDPKWIPVSHDAGGNHEMVDLAPAKGGKAGQIISVYHDDGGRSIEGPDFLTWLEAKLGAGG